MLLETRPQFLILTPVCVSVGFAAAIHDGYLNLLNLILATIGAILAHISVNVLNDYYDYKRGTDFLTVRTPFSGGSGFLPSKLVKPDDAYKLGICSLIAGLIIGFYFIFLYPVLLPIVGLAAIIIYTYTPFLTKIRVTEIFPGLAFGPLMVTGAYITQLPIRVFSISFTPIAASIPVGLLVTNLLFLNEFPDYEADFKTGRRHGVIVLGRRRASKAYVLILALVYISIVLPVVFNVLPAGVLISLASIPLAIRASKEVLENYNQVEKLIPGLAKNVFIVLLTPTLMTVGLLLSTL